MQQRQELDPDDTVGALLSAIEEFHAIKEYAQLIPTGIWPAKPETTDPQKAVSEEVPTPP